MTFAAYNLALLLLTPVALPYLIVRSRLRGQQWSRIPERLGFLPPSIRQTAPGAIWLHAVSVGEALSLKSLLGKLRDRFPDQRIYVSTSTPTGQRAAQEQLSEWADGFFFVPADFGWAVRRTFRTLRPRLLIVVETEIWPNLFREAKRWGSGLLLVNGRISDKALPRYLRWRRAFAQVLAWPDWILAQSVEDAERFVSIGAPESSVRVNGNLKFDLDPSPATPPPDLAAFLKTLSATPLIVAGSTREGEEAMAAAAFESIVKEHPQAVLAVAPRHPQRFDEAASALESAGLRIVRRSRLEQPRKQPGGQPPNALLIDSLGELSALYSLADLVFVGGSLNGWGGHNVLEPALLGKPIVVGPHMQNFREITDGLRAAGGLSQVSSAAELGDEFSRLLASPEAMEALAANARRYAEAQAGAGDRAAEAAVDLYRASPGFQPPATWKRAALGPAAAVWGWVARRRAARRGDGLPRPTLCVGNLTSGGSGKTPTVIWLIEQLGLLGRTPAVLSRGYGRSARNSSVIARAGERRSATQVGDEPALIQDRVYCAIGVGADRRATGVELLEAAPEVDVFVLDDGLQHVRLHRDLNLVLIDVSQPLWTDACLPLGRLREPLDGLARADAFLLTRTVPECRYEAMRTRLNQLNAAAPVFASRLRPAKLLGPGEGEEQPLESLAGRTVFAFCGLGNPAAFQRTLEGMGCRVAKRMDFPDHHRYSMDDWWRITAAGRASGAELTLTTEKDAMNLAEHVAPELRTGAPPLHVLSVELEVDDGARLIELIDTDLHAFDAEAKR